MLKQMACLLSVNDEQPIGVDQMTACTHTALLQASPFAEQQIDYPNVDCEGYDYEPLEGLELAKYRPKIITIEAILDDTERRLDLMLSQNSYKRISTGVLTKIYVLESH